MTALAQTFRPALANKWRYSAIEVDECLRFIRQHRRTIAERDERLPCGVPVHSAAYVAEAEKLLSLRLDLYLAAVRRVSEAEAEMDQIGMAYARSSDAWDLVEELREAA